MKSQITLKSTTFKKLAIPSIILAAALMSANAASLLLDFGPTAVASTNAALSPAHALRAVSSSETNWNTALTNNLTGLISNLVYGDGTPSTGVTLAIGRSEVLTSNVVDFTLSPRNSALGGFGNTGIYVGSSPAKDAIFGIYPSGDSGSTPIAVGLRLDGLPAGDYKVYFASRNTSTVDTGANSGPTPQQFYARAGASASTYTFSLSDTLAFETNSTPMNKTNFVLGDNCNVVTVTVGAGQSLFMAVQGTGSLEKRGFFNSVELVPFIANAPPLISVQPNGLQTVVDGTGATVIFSVTADGTGPLAYQWLHNSTNLPGATTNTLTLSNVTKDMAGNYSVFITNAYGSVTSSNASLVVATVPNTDQMTNIWTLSPGSSSYLTMSNTERSIAYDTVGTNLLLVSRSTQPASVVVLDPQTGGLKYFMNNGTVPNDQPGVSLGLNQVGVAADGAVFAGSVTISASSPPYNLYKWSQVDSNTSPMLVFAGDPGSPVQPNLRWGDTLAVRGAGAGTQILLAPGSGTNVALLQTLSGSDFQTEVPPIIIAVSGVPSGFAQSGLAYGPGTNTFWAIGGGGTNNLYLVQFDINASTGSVLYAYSPKTSVTNTSVGGLIGLAMDPTAKWLAGVSVDIRDNVRLFDLSNPAAPVQADEELVPTKNGNNVLSGGSASCAFGGNYLYALDLNNGIMAFQLNTNNIGTLGQFRVTSVQPGAGGTAVLGWQSVPGHSYQVQHTDSLSTPTWVNDGAAVVAIGSTTFSTNSSASSARFYRVSGQ